MNASADSAVFRFYAELNDFLPPKKRGISFQYPFSPHQTIKDLIEAQGIPHGEVDLILINGQSADFSARLKPGDRVGVYPFFGSIDIKAINRVRPEPLREMKFLLDVPLGRLAQHLRLFGFNTLWQRDYEDEEIARIASDQQRILLTRDRRLLMRKQVTHGYFVREILPGRQLVEILRRFDLIPLVSPFVRCLRCNGTLLTVKKETVDEQLEPKTRLYYEEFSRCDGCGRIYWKGSHYGKIQNFMKAILSEASCRSFSSEHLTEIVK